jgi:GntR family transcriptional regulator, transcriptional repressor for pyruvate dehydrogenase complex
VPDLEKEQTTSTIFHPVKPRRAFEEISAEIKRLIFKGTLKPGDRLPSETELANQFGVGRQTIREALRLLDLSGFISMQKGCAGGPLVVDTILNSIGNSFLEAFQMKRITIEELTVTRTEIEKIVIDYVLRNAEEADIKALEENISEARRKLENNLPAFDTNVQFHKLLARASKNLVFLIVMESIVPVISDSRSQLGHRLEVSERCVVEHEVILDTVRRKDRMAIDLLEQHLVRVGEGLSQAMAITD